MSIDFVNINFFDTPILKNRIIELRGGMDASQYKDYVLVLLFVKYISDKYADVPLIYSNILYDAVFNVLS